MLIDWKGHASFLIQTEGKKLLTDPFNADLGYPLVEESIDIVTVSHDHWDHNATESVQGKPHIVRGEGTHRLDNISIEGLKTFHDKSLGKQRGPNTVFKINSEGINLVHLGDLGELSKDLTEKLGKVDILLIPVGGVYTIDAEEALALAQEIKPSILIPMHYATPHLSFKLDPLENFTQHFEKTIYKKQLKITKETLPLEMQIIVLDYIVY